MTHPTHYRILIGRTLENKNGTLRACGGDLVPSDDPAILAHPDIALIALPHSERESGPGHWEWERGDDGDVSAEAELVWVADKPRPKAKPAWTSEPEPSERATPPETPWDFAPIEAPEIPPGVDKPQEPGVGIVTPVEDVVEDSGP